MMIRSRRFLIPHRTLINLLSVLAVSIVAYPAGAQEVPLPVPHEIALPSERELLKNLFAQMSAAGDEQASKLRALDAALVKLPYPTKLRGFVQFFRAQILISNSEEPQAMAAINESIRLLPNYSAPLIVASNIYTFSGEAGLGADFLLRACQIDPASVRRIQDYEINALIGRLESNRDRRRVGLLSDRLLQIGWIGEEIGSSSALATHAIKWQLDAGNLPAARALVHKLILPLHSRSLLVDKAYQQIWPEIEKAFGPKQERQWAIYLDEARKRWTASNHDASTQEYVSALIMAGHQDTLIRSVLPMFEKVAADDQFRLVFVVAPLAGALAHKDRWDEVDKLFDRAEKTWPLGSDANALNVTANRAKYLLHAGRPAEALAEINLAIADALTWKTEVGSSPLASMHFHKACALHELGRTAQAQDSIAIAINHSPVLAARLHLCLDDLGAARQALINGLKAPTEREHVIDFLQISEGGVYASAFSRRSQTRWQALQQDPQLRAETSKYGRVLPYRMADGAPAEKTEAELLFETTPKADERSVPMSRLNRSKRSDASSV